MLQGKSSAAIAAEIGCCRQAVDRYRSRVVRPALRTTINRPNLDRHEGDSLVTLSQDVAVAKQAITATPFHDRLQATWTRIERVLDRAEHAVQVTEDGDAVGEDLAILAPLLNQAHKNLELLGKASGELQDKAAAPSIAIQIVVPAASVQPRMSDEGYIDVGGAEIGSKR